MKQPKKDFDQFLEEYLGKVEDSKTGEFFIPKVASYCHNVINLVLNDIEMRNEYTDQEWYILHKPKVRRLLRAAIITTIWATGATEDDE